MFASDPVGSTMVVSRSGEVSADSTGGVGQLSTHTSRHSIGPGWTQSALELACSRS
jgi:hypothetical protein